MKKVETVRNRKIVIEPLLRNRKNIQVEQIQWYCFNGYPKLCLRIKEGTNNKTTLYDEKSKTIDDILSIGDEKDNNYDNKKIKQTYDLSTKLASEFLFVRIDFMVFQNKVYFEELTFSPYSGFNKYLRKKYNKKFGELLTI